MSSFEIKKLKSGENALFSHIHWAANQVILKFAGALLDKQMVAALPQAKLESVLQVGPNSYLDLTGDLSFFIRHSCNPNAVIKIIAKNAFLISTRAIKPNEELTFDYSISAMDNVDEWNMICKCASWNCRKTVSGFNTLSTDIKQDYIKKNVVPDYIKKQAGI